MQLRRSGSGGTERRHAFRIAARSRTQALLWMESSKAMCGRFTQTATGSELAEVLGVAPPEPPDERRYNIAPTQPIRVVVGGEQAQAERALAWRRWGLVPRWADDPGVGARMINARSETASSKPAFRDAIQRRRCAVPATGFYEWARGSKRRGPVWFRAAEAPLFAMAGIWERWKGPGTRALETAAILTTTANAVVAPTHHRMPVILSQEALARWLAPGALDDDELAELLVPCSDARLAARPVSTRVNDASFDDPSCLDEEEPPGLGPLFDGLGKA